MGEVVLQNFRRAELSDVRIDRNIPAITALAASVIYETETESKFAWMVLRMFDEFGMRKAFTRAGQFNYKFVTTAHRRGRGGVEVKSSD